RMAPMKQAGTRRRTAATGSSSAPRPNPTGSTASRPEPHLPTWPSRPTRPAMAPSYAEGRPPHAWPSRRPCRGGSDGRCRLRRYRPQPRPVLLPVVRQRDALVGLLDAVDGHSDDGVASADPADADVVERLPIPVVDLELRPPGPAGR